MSPLILGEISKEVVIIGTPVYFAGSNGVLCALLDRGFTLVPVMEVFLKGKQSAAVATCWRSGSSATLDRLNIYFIYSEMPVINGNYWNIKLEGTNPYGEDILFVLDNNMVEALGRR